MSCTKDKPNIASNTPTLISSLSGLIFHLAISTCHYFLVQIAFLISMVGRLRENTGTTTSNCCLVLNIHSKKFLNTTEVLTIHQIFKTGLFLLSVVQEETVVTFSVHEDFKTFNESTTFLFSSFQIATALILLMTFFLITYTFHCTWVTSEAYSSPSIVLSARAGDGGRIIFDDFREAYYWLRHNTEEVGSFGFWRQGCKNAKFPWNIVKICGKKCEIFAHFQKCL